MFSEPKKTPDGQYFVKPLERKLVQLNGVTFQAEKLLLSESAKVKINDVDVENLKVAKENCQTWFGRQVQDKTIENAYKKSEEGTLQYTQSPHIKGYNHLKEIVPMDTIADGTVCDVVVELSSLWFTKKAFGPIWKLLQVRTLTPPKKKYHEEYLFMDDDHPPAEEEEDEDLF